MHCEFQNHLVCLQRVSRRLDRSSSWPSLVTHRYFSYSLFAQIPRRVDQGFLPKSTDFPDEPAVCRINCLASLDTKLYWVPDITIVSPIEGLESITVQTIIVECLFVTTHKFLTGAQRETKPRVFLKLINQS